MTRLMAVTQEDVVGVREAGKVEEAYLFRQLRIEIEGGYQLHLLQTQFGLEVSVCRTPPGKDRVGLALVPHGPKRFDLRIVES